MNTSGTGQRPTGSRDVGNNTQKETVFLLFCWCTWVRYLEYACLDKTSSISRCHIGPSIQKQTVPEPNCFTFGEAPHCSASQGVTIQFPTNVIILAT